jgi:hypothetical protein
VRKGTGDEDRRAATHGQTGRRLSLQAGGSSNWFSSSRATGSNTSSLRHGGPESGQEDPQGPLDKLASERQGHRSVLDARDKKVAVGELLDALEADYRLRQVKSLPNASRT